MNNYNYTFLSESGSADITASETESALEELTEEITEETGEGAMSFKIDGNALLDSLPIMGKGMLGIFIVTAVIVLTVVVLNKVTGKKKKDDSKE